MSPVYDKPIHATEGFDVCIECGEKKKGHYYRRIFKGGIFEFCCKNCIKKKFKNIGKGIFTKKLKEGEE